MGGAVLCQANIVSYLFDVRCRCVRLVVGVSCAPWRAWVMAKRWVLLCSAWSLACRTPTPPCPAPPQGTRFPPSPGGTVTK